MLFKIKIISKNDTECIDSRIGDFNLGTGQYSWEYGTGKFAMRLLGYFPHFFTGLKTFYLF